MTRQVAMQEMSGYDAFMSKDYGQGGPVPRTMVGYIPGWRIDARWEPMTSGEFPDGPSSMTITLADSASPKVKQRGINSGVMRRVEALLSDFAKQRESIERERAHQEGRGGGSNTAFWDAISVLVTQLPSEGPRSKEGDYYKQLLYIHDLLEATEPDPIGDLARMLNAPANTIKSQIYRAKKMKEGGAN
jgi:hypothetical protein